MRKRIPGRWMVTLALSAVALLVSGAARAENPYKKPNESWISISGTVESVRPDSFTLDYGESTITVEMDDGDRDADGYKLMRGDKVTVNGRVDDDLFETTTIEASSVYVESLETWFYASAHDEEDFVTSWAPVEPARITVQGYVTDVDENEFTINSGARSIRVNVQEMAYDPLDKQGYQRIEVGDRVSVSGHLDSGLFEERELRAEAIVDLVS